MRDAPAGRGDRVRADLLLFAAALGTRAVHSLVHGITALAALVGVFVRRRDRRRDAFPWLALVTFTVVSAVYFPTTRMRAPVEFVLILFAGCGGAWAWRRLTFTGATTAGARRPR
jgi:hypothetical protein